MMSALSAPLYYYHTDDRPREAGFVDYGPEQQISFMMSIAAARGKPLWLGEFGPPRRDKTEDQERRQFESLLSFVIQNRVHLSALWNFDFEHPDQKHYNITADNHRAYMLDALQEANRRLADE